MSLEANIPEATVSNLHTESQVAVEHALSLRPAHAPPKVLHSLDFHRLHEYAKDCAEAAVWDASSSWSGHQSVAVRYLGKDAALVLTLHLDYIGSANSHYSVFAANYSLLCFSKCFDYVLTVLSWCDLCVEESI